MDRRPGFAPTLVAINQYSYPIFLVAAARASNIPIVAKDDA